MCLFFSEKLTKVLSPFHSRAQPSGAFLSASSSSDLASLRELEQELLLTENTRNIRNNEVVHIHILERALLYSMKCQSWSMRELSEMRNEC